MIKSYSVCLWISKAPITVVAGWQITRIRRDITAVPFIPYSLSPLRHFEIDSLVSAKFALQCLWSIERTQTGRRFPQENSPNTREICATCIAASSLQAVPHPSSPSRNRMKQSAILQHIFLWYKVHYLVYAAGVNRSLWFIVTASSWIRRIGFGRLPLWHALVKGQGLPFWLFCRTATGKDTHCLCDTGFTGKDSCVQGTTYRSQPEVRPSCYSTGEHDKTFPWLLFLAQEIFLPLRMAEEICGLPSLNLLAAKPIINSFLLFPCVQLHANWSQTLPDSC